MVAGSPYLRTCIDREWACMSGSPLACVLPPAWFIFASGRIAADWPGSFVSAVAPTRPAACQLQSLASLATGVEAQIERVLANANGSCQSFLASERLLL